MTRRKIMNKTELENDISLLESCELVRFTLKGDALELMVVADCLEEQEEHHHDEEEDHDCCMDGLNGHLFVLYFHGVKEFNTKGEECDNYVLTKFSCQDKTLDLEYDGFNLFESDSHIFLHFSYENYEVEDGGKIEGCGV